jgi:hypothetical protein
MNGGDEGHKSSYQFTVPDYLRPLDNPNNRQPTFISGDGPANPTVTIISKINGWITVDAKTMSRHDALEKRRKGDVKKPSLMAPEWMQTHQKRDE